MGIESNLGLFDDGVKEVSKINNDCVEYKNSIYDIIESVKTVANEYKVNLEQTIKYDGIDSAFNYIKQSLGESQDLAERQYNAVEKYNKGNYSMLTTFDGISVEEAMTAYLFGNNTAFNPSIATRVIATTALGILKGAEGFLSFYEDIGDAIVFVGSSYMSLMGNEEVANRWIDAAKVDSVTKMIEDNKIFEKIDKYSYWNKDSAYANMCKLVGTGSGAVVLGHFVSSIYLFKTAKNTGSVVSNISKKHLFNTITNAGTTTSGIGSNVSTNLQQGYSFENSFILGTVVAGTTIGLSKGGSIPAAKNIVDKFNSTSVGVVKNNVNNKLETSAVNVFGKETVDAVNVGYKSAVDLGTKQVKSNTSDLVEDDCNQKSEGDMALEVGAKAAIDFGKTIITHK